MSANRRRKFRSTMSVAVACLFFLQITAVYTGAYDLGTTVADMRQASSRSGGTSCPQLTRFDISTPGSINRQWSTSLGTNPVTILTADQTPAGRLNEIQAVIQQSLSVWTGVSGTLLAPSGLGRLQRTSTTAACTLIRRNQFHLLQSERCGVHPRRSGVHARGFRGRDGRADFPTTAPSTFVGQILDADVCSCPATPARHSPLPPRCPRIRTPTTWNRS